MLQTLTQKCSKLAVSDDRGAGQIYNVGEDPTRTEREWIQQMGKVVGWRGDVVTLDDEQLPAQLRQPHDWRYHLATDTRRIREELGYREPVLPHEAIEVTLQWERSHFDDGRPDYAAEDAKGSSRRGPPLGDLSERALIGTSRAWKGPFFPLSVRIRLTR